MARVTGLGGAFLRAADPKALYAWYEEHLGIGSPHGSFVFPHETQRASIAVAFFPKISEYFPVSQPAMLNFQVDDLDGVLDKLKAVGVAVDPKREEAITGDLDGLPIQREIGSSFGNRPSKEFTVSRTQHTFSEASWKGRDGDRSE